MGDERDGRRADAEPAPKAEPGTAAMTAAKRMARTKRRDMVTSGE